MRYCRIVAGGMILLAGLISHQAAAQDCDRYLWACQGATGWHPAVTAPRVAPPRPPEPTVAPMPAEPTVRPRQTSLLFDSGLDHPYATSYGPIGGEPFPVPAVRLSDIDPAYLRKTVYYPTSEPPGTIVIDAHHHFLYFIGQGGQAIRYGVGVGREGFGWAGVATIHNKQEWPDWYPPKEMIARQPEIRRAMTELQSGIGMHGGPGNPLGARAMYLWQGNKDTLFRIHGTVEPWTIGKNVSSGCIRMINQDAIDLYQRTSVGTKVVVLR
jgi:lipoprotein-anchoring transpeptidase ErfK/SrfK